MTYSINTLKDSEKSEPSSSASFRFTQEVSLLLTAVILGFWTIALLTHHVTDGAWSTSGVDATVANWMGRVGAWVAPLGQGADGGRAGRVHHALDACIGRCVEQVRCSFGRRVKDEGGIALGCVNGGGVEEAVASIEEFAPAVRIQHVTLHEFEAVLAGEVGRMREHVVDFARVGEVPDRAFHGVSVLKQVPNDVVADMTVDAGHKYAERARFLHMPRRRPGLV